MERVLGYALQSTDERSDRAFCVSPNISCNLSVPSALALRFSSCPSTCATMNGTLFADTMVEFEAVFLWMRFWCTIRTISLPSSVSLRSSCAGVWPSSASAAFTSSNVSSCRSSSSAGCISLCAGSKLCLALSKTVEKRVSSSVVSDAATESRIESRVGNLEVSFVGESSDSKVEGDGGDAAEALDAKVVSTSGFSGGGLAVTGESSGRDATGLSSSRDNSVSSTSLSSGEVGESGVEVESGGVVCSGASGEGALVVADPIFSSSFASVLARFSPSADMVKGDGSDAQNLVNRE